MRNGRDGELKIIIESWGDTFDDDRMLEAIRNFNRTGGYYTAVGGLTSEARNSSPEEEGQCREIAVVPPAGAFSGVQPSGQSSRSASLSSSGMLTMDRFATPWNLRSSRSSGSGPGGLLQPPDAEIMKMVRELLGDNFSQVRRLH